jgi:hypothetical protein
MMTYVVGSCNEHEEGMQQAGVSAPGAQSLLKYGQRFALANKLAGSFLVPV